MYVLRRPIYYAKTAIMYEEYFGARVCVNVCV